MKKNEKRKTKNEKRKVLIINTTFNRGGAAQIARMIYKGLKKDVDIVPYFYYGRGKKSEDKNVFKTFFTYEFFIHLIFVRFLGLEGFGSYFTTRALTSFIKKKKIDLIHLHNVHGYYLNLSFMQYLNSLNIPIIWTFHDVWPITGRCAYFTDCEKWQNYCYNCQYLSTYPKTYVDRSTKLFKKKKFLFTKLKNLTIITPSIWLKDIVNKSYLQNKKIGVISNGVDIDLFKVLDKNRVREELNILREAKCILYIASDIDDERKGFKYFVDCIKMIKTKELQILTVGEISKKTKQRMKKFNCLHFGKVQNKKKLVSIYNSSDLFIISSLEDNFPNTVLEAMACGVPVIGFKTGGIPEQVDNKSGILVEKKDVKGLAYSIDSLLNNKSALISMSSHCRIRSESNYSLNLMVENYKKLYMKK